MGSDPIRRPAVAGQFYPGNRRDLLEEIRGCYQHSLGPGRLPTVAEPGPREIVGLVVPHAGYTYSGPTAARGYYELGQDGRPAHIIVLSPCHRPGRVHAVVTQTSGAWETPLGLARIDETAAEALRAAAPGIAADVAAFAGEHSLEVQVPLLQHLYGEAFSFVPVMLVDQSFDAATLVGNAIAEAFAGQDVAIVASTDMTHFQTAEVAREQDSILIERMLQLDPDGLLREQARRRITMCGYGPVAAMLIAAKRLGATSAEAIAYSNSGDIVSTGEVVAYLSLKVTK